MWKWIIALLVVLLAAAALVARLRTSGAMHRPSAPAATPVATGCQAPEKFVDAARTNGRSLRTLDFEPFGREEIGWEVYAPAIAAEIGTDCAPDTPGFAAALADWQQQKPRGLDPTGVFGDTSFQEMHLLWRQRRPFVQATAAGRCPPEPAASRLAAAQPAETYAGKPIGVRSGALAAYRRLVAAARREDPPGFKDHHLLTLLAGYGGQGLDAAPCQDPGDCGEAAPTRCSPHRAGLALDLYLGAPPGFDPDDDSRRLAQARSPAYRWLLRNAARFGFVGYPLEPWHWEWTGEPVSS